MLNDSCDDTIWKSAYRDIALFPIHTFDYPYHITTVFPAQVDPLSRVNSRTGANGNADPSILQTLSVVDYRYARFALDPRTGLFSMVRSVSQSAADVQYINVGD